MDQGGRQGGPVASQASSDGGRPGQSASRTGSLNPQPQAGVWSPVAQYCEWLVHLFSVFFCFPQYLSEHVFVNFFFNTTEALMASNGQYA